ncbi:hypothetical protein C8R46DRAFT_1341951 [Mycena filopes]|nr:hypothetical protein C8R46DRAFT_1341951 [Mycena filopes]
MRSHIKRIEKETDDPKTYSNTLLHLTMDPPSRRRGHEYISELNRRYGAPAKEFLQESYEEHPLATTAVMIFAVTSFTPVVGAIALAAFTVCLAVCATIVTVIGLALGLATLLSTTLFSSLVLTFLVAGAIRLRTARRLARSSSRRRATAAQAAHTDETSEAAPPTSKRRRIPGFPGRFRPTLGGLHRRGSWKARVLVLLVLCDAVSRIRLPRALRYTFLYRTLFGATLFGPRRTHFLQQLLAAPFALLRVPLKLAVWVPLRVFGWKAPLVLYLVLLVLSPRMRGKTRGKMAGGLRRLWRTAGGSEQVARMRGLPWKAYTATALEYTRAGLTALIEFLRVQLEQLEDKAQPAADTPDTDNSVPTPKDTAHSAATHDEHKHSSYSDDGGSEYEMVSDIPILLPSTAASSSETLRSRKSVVSDEA